MHFAWPSVRIVFSAALVWSYFVTNASADDATWTSQQDRCSIALPNAEWKQKPSPDPNIKWFAANTDGTKIIALAVFDAQGLPALSRSGFDKGYLKAAHAKKLKGNDFAIERRTAYRLVAEETGEGKTISHVVVAVLSRDRVYRLAAQSVVGDADRDSEINAGISSFHLFDPPDQPAVTNHAQPAKEGWVTWISTNVGGWCVLVLIGLLIYRFATKAAAKSN